MKFMVTGHAFVPVKVQIEVEADSSESAMHYANMKLIRGIQPHIVSGSEDYGAAFRFDAYSAESLPSTRELTKE